MKRLAELLLVLIMIFGVTACGSETTASSASANTDNEAGDISEDERSAFSENPDAIDLACKSVVQLTVYDKKNNSIAGGSGFFAFDSKTIVTNYHVIENGYSVEVVDDEDNRYKVLTIRNINR